MLALSVLGYPYFLFRCSQCVTTLPRAPPAYHTLGAAANNSKQQSTRRGEGKGREGEGRVSALVAGNGQDYAGEGWRSECSCDGAAEHRVGRCLALHGGACEDVERVYLAYEKAVNVN